MPFESRGLPGVFGGGCSAAQAVDEIEEKDELGCGEEEGRVGGVEVGGDGVGEERAGGAEGSVGAGDSGELSVLAGFAGESREMHGEEDGVGSDEGAPEVEMA